MTMKQGGQSEPVTVEAIAIRAYEIYLGRGGEDGRDVENWQQAEAELQGGQGSSQPMPEGAREADERRPEG